MNKIKLADIYKLIDVLEKSKDENPKVTKIIGLLKFVAQYISDNSFKILDKDEAISLFAKKFGTEEDLKSINFNDEIVEIEEIGERETIDIEVDGNHLYYANDILTHNSAYNNLDSGLESISESMGVIMTADVSMLLLSNEELKEKKQVILKTEKNRYTGKLDRVLLQVDWPKMKFKGVDEIEDESINELKKLTNENIINETIDKTYENIAIDTSVIDDDFEFD